MALHRVAKVTVGVPDVASTAPGLYRWGPPPPPPFLHPDDLAALMTGSHTRAGR